MKQQGFGGQRLESDTKFEQNDFPNDTGGANSALSGVFKPLAAVVLMVVVSLAAVAVAAPELLEPLANVASPISESLFPSSGVAPSPEVSC